MKTIRHSLIAAACAAVLSACGGSGDSIQTEGGPDFNGGDDILGTLDDNFNSVNTIGSGSWTSTEALEAGANFSWFANELNANGLSFTVPSTPTATYNGSMIITKEVPSPGNISGEIYYGRMQMDVDFVNSGVTGSFGDIGRVFDGSNPSSVSGSATISGNIDGGNQINSSLAGSINGASFTGTMTGDFFTHNDTGRELISGFADINIDAPSDALGSFLLTK